MQIFIQDYYQWRVAGTSRRYRHRVWRIVAGLRSHVVSRRIHIHRDITMIYATDTSFYDAQAVPFLISEETKKKSVEPELNK